MKRLSRSVLVLSAITGTLLAALPGCGGGEFKTAPVTGKVTYQGQPVTAGSLTFAPVASGEKALAGRPGTGAVKSDGTYTLSTHKEGDGAVVGPHRVSYSPPPAENKTIEVDGSVQAVEPTEPQPYQGLAPKQPQVDVAKGSNTIDIELIPSPTPGAGPAPSGTGQ
jgi:hypothetical protein